MILNLTVERYWNLWANACGLMVVSLLAAYPIVSAFTSDGPVSIHTNQKLLTPRIIVGRSLIYEVTVDRREACPGYITDVFQRTDGNNRFQIVMQRAVVTTKVALTPKLRIAVALPDTVTVGKWLFVSTLHSECPTRKRDDTLIEAPFEVYQE